MNDEPNWRSQTRKLWLEHTGLSPDDVEELLDKTFPLLEEVLLDDETTNTEINT
jgi:hypothetical protein